MKLQKIEEVNNGKGDTRYVLSITQDEKDIMLDLLKKVDKFIPKCESSVMVKDRINDMINSFKFCRYADKKWGKDFSPK